MLFDLKGKRRRLVQAVYLTLAVLMGGGLVLFGIGSDAQGGLLDGCGSADSSSQGGNPAAQQQLEDAEAQLAADPEDEAALTALVRANYQLANDAADPSTGAFGPEGTARLEAASDAWQRYLALDLEKPDDSLAGLMLQAYSELGLNDPASAAEAAGIVAEARPSTRAFLAQAQYATLAGEKRTAELAGDRAVELAPKAQRKRVEQQLKQLAAAQTEAATVPGGGATPGAPQPPPAGGTPAGGGPP